MSPGELRTAADAPDRRGTPAHPVYGSRQMTAHLKRLGHLVNRKCVQQLMRQMRLQAVYPKPCTSRPQEGHRIYPYLLRGAPQSGVGDRCDLHPTGTRVHAPGGHYRLVQPSSGRSTGTNRHLTLRRASKAASSPARPSPRCWRPMMFGSAWTARVVTRTTSSWSGSGAA
ncbi:IS3 family transposase [Halomonas elongata]|uniref:IS3 family transposase n=1 Tax=Halomonas elongata TaxID=2746 RepID=UPI0038D51505